MCQIPFRLQLGTQFLDKVLYLPTVACLLASFLRAIMG